MDKKGLEFEMMGKILLWLGLLLALVIVIAAMTGQFSTFVSKMHFLSFLD